VWGSSGPGGDTKARAPWSHQLDAAEAAALLPEQVLAGADGWNPRAAVR
jgi:hypothetical protein